MLYGMAEPIKKTFSEMGYRVREYAPVGELIPGMAYLVRRLLENTSNESWLRGKFADGKTTAELLKDPSIGLVSTSALHKKNEALFHNAPLLDFAVSSVRENMSSALSKLKSELPKTVLPSVAGLTQKNPNNIYQRKNPSLTSEVIAEVHMASTEMAENAIQAAHKAYASWKKVSPQERASLLDKAADLMVKNKYNLIATQIL